MTVLTTNPRTDAIGNGATGVYPYTYKVFSEDDLEVVVADPVTNLETVLTKTTDYTVDGVGDPSGGNVTLVQASPSQAWMDGAGNLENLWPITIQRSMEFKQQTDIANQKEYFADVHEDTFDTLLMQLQQIKNDIDGALRLPDTVDPSTVDTELPAPQPNQSFRWNNAGTGLENFTLAPTGTIVLPGALGFMVQTVSGGTFTARALASGQGITIGFANGVSGNPALSLAAGGILGIHMGPAVVTVDKMAANSVGTTQLVNLSVTTGKIASGAITTNLLAALSVATANLQASAVSEAKIAAAAVTLNKIADGAVNGNKLGEGTIQVYFTVNATQTQTGLVAADIFNATIQGGVLAANRMARLEAVCDFTNPDGVPRDVVVNLIYGGTTIATVTLTIPATTTEQFKLTALMGNQGVVSQRGVLTVDAETVRAAHGGLAAEDSSNPLAFRIETDWVVSAAATANLHYGSLTIHK